MQHAAALQYLVQNFCAKYGWEETHKASLDLWREALELLEILVFEILVRRGKDPVRRFECEISERIVIDVVCVAEDANSVLERESGVVSVSAFDSGLAEFQFLSARRYDVPVSGLGRSGKSESRHR